MGRSPKCTGRPPPGAQPSWSTFCQHRHMASWAMHHAPWAPRIQTPAEAPWATCPWWAVWASCLVAGMTVHVEGLLLSSAQNVEADHSCSVVLSTLLPVGTVGCTDRSCLSGTPLCRAPNKAAHDQSWPVWGFLQPPKARGFKALWHIWNPFMAPQLGPLWSSGLLRGRDQAILFLFYFLNLCMIGSPAPSSFTSYSKDWLNDWVFLYCVGGDLAISCWIYFLPNDNLTLSTVLVPQKGAWNTQH